VNLSKRRAEIVFKKTALGQMVYDVLMSRMSAKRAAKKYDLPLSFVIDQRIKFFVALEKPAKRRRRK
jgi:hypothetical protein